MKLILLHMLYALPGIILVIFLIIYAFSGLPLGLPDVPRNLVLLGKPTDCESALTGFTLSKLKKEIS